MGEEEEVVEEEHGGGDDDDDDDAGPCEKLCGGLCTMLLGCVIFPIVLIMIAVNERSVICRSAAATKISEWEKANCSNAKNGEFMISCPVTKTGATPSGSTIPGLLNVTISSGTEWNRLKRTPSYCVCTQKKLSESPTFEWEYSSAPQKKINCDISNVSKVITGCAGFGVGNCKKAGEPKPSTTEYNPFLVGAYTYPIEESPFRPSGSDYADSDAVKEYTYSGSEACNSWASFRAKNELAVIKRSHYTFPARVESDSETSYHITAATASGPFYCGGSNTITGILGEEATNEKWLEEELGAQSSTNIIFRILLLFASWGAVYCCCSPIATGADIVGDYLAMIPGVGEQIESILEGAVDFLVICLSCVMGCSCGLMCMALAWVIVRPLVAIPLLLVGCLAVGGGIYYGQTTENENAAKIKAKKAKRRGANPYATEMAGGQALVEEVA